jgi:hypothetical protein
MDCMKDDRGEEDFPDGKNVILGHNGFFIFTKVFRFIHKLVLCPHVGSIQFILSFCSLTKNCC